MKKSTIAIDTKLPRKDAFGSIAMPVYHTASYEFETAKDMADAFCGRVLAPDYSRVMNPTVMHFEDQVKALTGAENVFAFCSGMAAITNAFFTVIETGKNVVTSHHLFGNTVALLNKTFARFGVESRQVDLLDLEAVRQAIDDQTSCLFLEIVTNPQMEVADIAALAEIAHERGIPLIADTTIIPFTQFSAKALGVDVEVVSSTKYISGGATSLGGLVIDYGTFPVVNQRIRFELLFNVGSYMSPHAAYMQSLGLETLEARYKVQSSNALALARKLQTVEGIQRVNYIGLEDNPFHTLALKQFGETAGAMLTIDLADRKACFSFIDHLQLIRRATNLFDNKTLAIHPYSTIFGPFGKSQKVEMDVRDTTIRLSVGLEDVDDIFEDIRQAVAAIP
ncbi:MAG: aminotransferase class V-fold PLP-dependent enzyme [Bacteroidales bacterium]|nr:aminotransferase class V-fold PLP-dependent enzyme [Bacteroidaceae bacterium]MDO4200519.1 aminotransferase class V-fold PLP-dependent enzyme [Bacteroidales bacterium]